LGPSSAKQGVDSPANNPAARTMAAAVDTNDRRKEGLSVRFVMFGCSCF
jgi:hypothetical protein